MALLIPEGFAQVAVPMTHTGLLRSAVVTWGCSFSTGGDPLSQQLDFMFQQFFENWGTYIDDAVEVGPMTGRFNNGGLEPIAAEGTESDTGGSVDNKPPGNVALLVRKSSNRGGRRGRGRFYLPWALGEGAVDEIGNVESSARALLQTAADDFLLALGTASGEEGPNPMYLLHSEEPDQSTLPGTPSLVTALTVDSIIATQRRRLGR